MPPPVPADDLQSAEWDVVVGGAGPAGLSVAAECSYHGVPRVLVLEKGETHNQTVLRYYPDDKRVDAAYRGQEAVCAGVLCFRDTTKAGFLDLVDRMLALYRFELRVDEGVDSIRRRPRGGFAVSTTEGAVHPARHVVVAIGRMSKPRRPDYFEDIPPAARRRVRFDVRGLGGDGEEVLVVGGGNSAVEYALSLAPRATVTLSYRRRAFTRLNPMNLGLLEAEERAGRLGVLRDSDIARVAEDGARPLVFFRDGSRRAFDWVVYGIGGSSPAGFLSGTGIALSERGEPVLSERLETSVTGLFVAGELSVPPGKGSIIASFNSGKVVADAITARLGIRKRPDVVRLPAPGRPAGARAAGSDGEAPHA